MHRSLIREEHSNGRTHRLNPKPLTWGQFTETTNFQTHGLPPPLARIVALCASCITMRNKMCDDHLIKLCVGVKGHWQFVEQFVTGDCGPNPGACMNQRPPEMSLENNPHRAPYLHSRVALS